jgi:tetratricopeptide (TPR) repeat protein
MMGRVVQQSPVSQSSLPWRILGLYLPLGLIALGAFFIVRNLADGGESSPSFATIDPGHAARLDENVRFFETRVIETKDPLSYNRLVSLYLQRLRERGDVADVARAESAATKAIETSGRDYGSLISLGLVRLAQHDFEAALRTAEEAIIQIPARPDAFALRGDALMALGRYGEASGDYQYFLEKAPGSGAFSRQATLAEVRGNVAVAEQFWQAAIDADSLVPESAAWARVQLGNLQFSQGELAAADESFKAALRAYPGYSAALAGRGHVAAARHRWDDAITHLKGASTAVPSPEYVIALGEAYARAGRADDARRQFALVGAIAQLFAANGVTNELVLLQFELDRGDAGPALRGAQAAYDARPSVVAADLLAWALFKNGRLAEAQRYSLESLAQGTNDPQLFYHAAEIFAASGELAQARVFANRARELNPAFSIRYEEPLKALLTRLEGTR